MIAAVALLLALARVPALQELPLAGYDPELLHAEAAYSERTRLFLDAWLGADEAGRAQARAVLARERRSGAPAASPPTLPALMLAGHALDARDTAEEEGAAKDLQALADALDLRPVPGFFAARREGRGELITVRVRRLWPVRPPGAVNVSLWWLPPEGQGDVEPLRARSEPAAPEAFEGRGFEMFIRPPVSEPGDWRLALELEQAGMRARGVPVLVQSLTDPSAAIGLAREVLEGEGSALELARGLIALQRAGARLPAGLAPSLSLELLRDRLGTRPGSRPRPVELSLRDEDGRERWVWAWMPVEPPRAAVILVAPSHEPPQAVFQGETGRLWRDAAKQLSALFLSAHLPRSGAGGEELAARLGRLHELARDLGGELPVALVARGDSLDLVQRALAAGGAPFVGWIAVSPREGEPRLRLPEGLPALLVAPGGPAQVAALESGLQWVGGERELLLDEPLLPRIASGWLRAILASRREELQER